MICRGATQLDPLNHSWCSRWSQLCVRPFPAVPRGTGAAAALQRKRRNLGRGGASARGRGWLCLHSKEDCVKLYHWSNWSKCFKEVEHQEPPATWHTHTHTLPSPALPEVAGLGSMARAAARKSRVDSHLHLWTPDEVHGTRWREVYGGTCVIQPPTCLVHGNIPIHDLSISYKLYYVLLIITWS